MGKRDHVRRKTQMVSRSLAAVLVLITSVALAAESPIKILGPEVGQPFPLTLAAVDQAGKTQSLKSLMGKKGLAVFFVRSADWCPFCKGQLVDANRHLARFRELGVSVVSISVDEVAPIVAFAQEQHIGYPMLSDPHGDINLSLGIRDPQYPVGSPAFGVPKPTLYILDRQGVIRLRYQEPTYRTRPNLDGVLHDMEAAGL
jgi:peroxiredoxin